MKRREFARMATLGVAAASIGAGASAQARMVLEAADVHPTGYPTVAAVEAMGKKMEAATGHLMIPELLAFSKRTFNSVSRDDQALLVKVSREAQRE
jgi:TRAP-type C4-dicarboxylate transport system substrate-binding protein